MKKLITVILLGCMSTLTYASDGWLTDYEQAKKMSAEKGVPILADFSGSDWCMWCVRLDKEVFNQSEFKEYAKKNLVLLMVDFPQRKKLPDQVTKQNRELAQKYEIRGFPTVLLLDKNGKQIGKTGYRQGGPQGYIKHLSELISKDQK